MTDQLALLEKEPEPLTARQQQAYDHLKAAGPDGLTAHELGVLLYGERPEARSWGGHAAQALRKKGLAARRGKPPVWVAIQTVDTKQISKDHRPSSERLPPGMTTEIPF